MVVCRIECCELDLGHFAFRRGRGSVWWSNLINIHQGVGAGVVRWIDDNYVCEVGDEL
jgi:hypothetical protein